MKVKIFFYTFLMIWFSKNSFASKSIELILQGKAALVINNTRLYEDSSYLKPTLLNLKENDLVEWLSSTTNEYLDNAQNQLFKWHFVKTLSGKTGWIYGDELAIPTPILRLESKLRPYVHQKKNLGASFESAIIWFGSIEGKDVKKGKSFFNPIYKESYIVFSNDVGKSLALNYANASESGKSELNQIWISDFTKDGKEDILWEKRIESVDNHHVERSLEIYSILAGNLQKIWDEKLDESLQNKIFNKKYLIKEGIIRISTLELMDNDQYSLSSKSKLSTYFNAKAIESSTLSLKWNSQSKTIDTLYGFSKIAPKVDIIQLTQLLLSPSDNSTYISILNPPEKCTLLQFIEKPEKSWFYIRTNGGNYGFIPANALSTAYYQQFIGFNKNSIEIIVE